MTFGDKLKIARNEAGLKQAELAKQLNTTGNTISNWENNVSKPDLDTLAFICGILHVNASYFLQAALPEDEVSIKELKMIKKYRFISEHSPLGAKEVTACLNREYSIAEQLLAKDSRISELEATWDKKIRFIQYYQRLASAGTGQIVFDTPPTELIEIPDLPKYKYVKYAIGVNGDSMEPKYHDGDILLIEPTEEINIGEVGIFIVDNEAYVKELGAKELISLNHDYPNIQLTEYSKCMGRVIDKLEDKIK